MDGVPYKAAVGSLMYALVATQAVLEMGEGDTHIQAQGARNEEGELLFLPSLYTPWSTSAHKVLL